MRDYTASLSFVHPTFGACSSREELFLHRTAPKGTEKLSPFGQHVRPSQQGLPDVEKKPKPTNLNTKTIPTHPG